MDQKPGPARSLSGTLERNGSGMGITGRRERTMHEMVIRRSWGWKRGDLSQRNVMYVKRGKCNFLERQVIHLHYSLNKT